MENILHKLYRGELSPAEGYEARLEEYQQMRERLSSPWVSSYPSYLTLYVKMFYDKGYCSINLGD